MLVFPGQVTSSDFHICHLPQSTVSFLSPWCVVHICAGNPANCWIENLYGYLFFTFSKDLNWFLKYIKYKRTAQQWEELVRKSKRRKWRSQGHEEVWDKCTLMHSQWCCVGGAGMSSELPSIQSKEGKLFFTGFSLSIKWEVHPSKEKHDAQYCYLSEISPTISKKKGGGRETVECNALYSQWYFLPNKHIQTVFLIVIWRQTISLEFRKHLY